jgi:Xaa-Pro aminopeptidase
MILCREVSTSHSFGDKPWLGFEYVTMTPLCRKLLDPSLLTDREKGWVNAYHKKVWEKTKGYFEGGKNGGELTLKWLERECAAY